MRTISCDPFSMQSAAYGSSEDTLVRAAVCMILDSPIAFERLGSRSILERCVENLEGIRGVDEVVFAGSAQMLRRAGKIVQQQELLTIPAAVARQKSAEVDNWLLAHERLEGFGTVALVRPTTPFLPGAKLEQCVRSVARGQCGVCVPARGVDVVGQATFTKVQAAVRNVRAVLAATGGKSVKINHVPVSLIESLDAAVHDEFVMMSALVDSGKI